MENTLAKVKQFFDEEKSLDWLKEELKDDKKIKFIESILDFGEKLDTLQLPLEKTRKARRLEQMMNKVDSLEYESIEEWIESVLLYSSDFNIEKLVPELIEEYNAIQESGYSILGSGRNISYSTMIQYLKTYLRFANIVKETMKQEHNSKEEIGLFEQFDMLAGNLESTKAISIIDRCTILARKAQYIYISSLQDARNSIEIEIDTYASLKMKENNLENLIMLGSHICRMDGMQSYKCMYPDANGLIVSKNTKSYEQENNLIWILPKKKEQRHVKDGTFAKKNGLQYVSFNNEMYDMNFFDRDKYTQDEMLDVLSGNGTPFDDTFEILYEPDEDKSIQEFIEEIKA